MVKEATAVIDSMQVYSVKHEVVVETALSGDLMLWQRCSISLRSNGHSCADECMPSSTFNRFTNTASAFPFHRYSYSQGPESHLVCVPRTMSFILNLYVHPSRRAKPQQHVSILFLSAVCMVCCFELGLSLCRFWLRGLLAQWAE